MEVKIQIPDNCELIKDGDTYIVREKKQGPPRSWEEFCERYPVRGGETYICTDGNIYTITEDLNARKYRNRCVSKEEAEAFLALMQLRQLRKAWVGDWKSTEKEHDYGIIAAKDGSLEISCYDSLHRSMLFPTNKMAKEFLECFKDLCNTAAILL